MLASSSKRALISTSTTTCLPASAASISASTIGRVAGGAVQRLLDGQHVRVGGGLLDEPLHAGGEASRTGGAPGCRPRAAWRRRSWASRRSAKRGWVAGTNGASLRSGRSQRRRAATARRGRAGPGTCSTSSAVDVELAQQQLEHLRRSIVVGDLEPHGAGRTGAGPARAPAPAAGPRRGPPRPRGRRCG